MTDYNLKQLVYLTNVSIMKTIYIIFTFIVVFATTSYQVSWGKEECNDIRKTFYQKYQSWLNYTKTPEMRIESGWRLYDDDSMRDIIAIGPLVIPIILETMHNKSDTMAFHLGYALKKITKVEFNNFVTQASSTSATLYQSWEMWYRNSDKYTKSEFEILIAARRGFDHKENPKLLEEIDRRIGNIGIFVLPYLIDEISKGDVGLIPTVSYLSDKKIATNAAAEECLSWWKENKERFAKPNNQGHFDTFRNWTSTTGQFSIHAKFISATDNQVSLEKEDGSIINVDLSKLSKIDQVFVERQKSQTKRISNHQ
jgi:hypothetical protein